MHDSIRDRQYLGERQRSQEQLMSAYYTLGPVASEEQRSRMDPKAFASSRHAQEEQQ